MAALWLVEAMKRKFDRHPAAIAASFTELYHGQAWDQKTFPWAVVDPPPDPRIGTSTHHIHTEPRFKIKVFGRTSQLIRSYVDLFCEIFPDDVELDLDKPGGRHNVLMLRLENAIPFQDDDRIWQVSLEYRAILEGPSANALR